VLPSEQKLTLGMLATIMLKEVPFRAYVPFPDGNRIVLIQ
jgi:hypothetical protein